MARTYKKARPSLRRSSVDRLDKTMLLPYHLLLCGAFTALASAAMDFSEPTWPAGTYTHYPRHVHCPNAHGRYDDKKYWFDRSRLKEAAGLGVATASESSGIYVGDAKNRWSTHISVQFRKPATGIYEFRSAWNADTGRKCHPIY